MGLFVKISVALICLFFVWRIYKVIQANPQLLSRENLRQSFLSMGILGLILIGFVAVLVMMLR